MAEGDFDLKGLYRALDERRRERGLTWKALAVEVNCNCLAGRSVAVSTITGLAEKAIVEGDGVLQMLTWLDLPPEHFVPGGLVADAAAYRWPLVASGQILRWDTAALFAAADARRLERAMTWNAVAEEVGGCTPGMLKNLSRGGRTRFPLVMRLVRWLGRPAVTYTKVDNC